MKDWQRDLIIPFIIATTLPAAAATLLVSASPVDDLDEMARRMRAQELYHEDQINHQSWCPFRTWEQPGIDIYEKYPHSHLPEGCAPPKRKR